MDELTKAEFDRVHDEDARQNHRLEIIEGKVEKFTEIALSIKELTINMSHMCEAQKTMQEDLEAIKQAPADKWNKAIWVVVTAILSCVVGYALKSIGM